MFINVTTNHRESSFLTFLKCSLRHVVTLRQRRLIPSIRLGNCVRYNLPDAEKAIQKLTIRAV